MNTHWKQYITDKGENPKEKVQKRVGIVGGCFFVLLGIGDFLFIGFIRGTPLPYSFFHPGVLPLLLVGIIFILSGLYSPFFFRMFQVTVFIIIGTTAYCIAQTPGIITGPVFFIYGIILALQYGFLDRHFEKKIIVSFSFYSGSNLIFSIIESTRPLYMGILDIGISMLLLYFLWAAFAEDIQYHRIKTKQLREELEENRLFIQFGKHMAGLVHTMKSKLMSIQGFNEVLEKYTEDPKLNTFLKHQKKAINQMVSLTSNLLFSIKSFNESSTHVISLDKVVQGVLEIYSSDSVFRKEVRIKKVLRQAYCIASPREIIIMVENIITNALEAMEQREQKELSIETGVRESRSFFSVSDTGGGFSFCPVNCSRTTCTDCPYMDYGKSTKTDGTGLGMATVRDTLKSLRGDLIVESNAGEGSSVTVFLPFDKTA